jgi:hypothetical protein
MVTAPNLISLVVATAQVVLMFTVDGITEAGAGSSSSEPPLCSAVRRANLCASDELADLTSSHPEHRMSHISGVERTCWNGAIPASRGTPIRLRLADVARTSAGPSTTH